MFSLFLFEDKLGALSLNITDRKAQAPEKKLWLQGRYFLFTLFMLVNKCYII